MRIRQRSSPNQTPPWRKHNPNRVSILRLITPPIPSVPHNQIKIRVLENCTGISRKKKSESEDEEKDEGGGGGILLRTSYVRFPSFEVWAI